MRGERHTEREILEMLAALQGVFRMPAAPQGTHFSDRETEAKTDQATRPACQRASLGKHVPLGASPGRPCIGSRQGARGCGVRGRWWQVQAPLVCSRGTLQLKVSQGRGRSRNGWHLLLPRGHR